MRSHVHSGAPGDLRLDLTFTNDVEPAIQDTLRLLFREVAAFVQCGALGGLHLDPTHVSAQAAAPSVTGRIASQQFSNVRLDRGAAACLLNIATWTHHHVLPLSAVKLSWDQLPARGGPPVLGFPAVWPRLAYRLDIDDPLDRRFAIEVNFVQPQPEETLEQINDDIFALFTAINRGAYGQEGGIAAENICIYLSGDTIQTLPNQITWFIDTFHCADAALDGFANLFQKINDTRAAISHVEIS